MRITVEVEKLEFEFSSFRQWVQKARSWFIGAGMEQGEGICVDRLERICRTGSDFERAAKDDAFPVKVYSIDVD